MVPADEQAARGGVIVPEECVCDRGTVSHRVALFEIRVKYGEVVPLADVLEYVAP